MNTFLNDIQFGFRQLKKHPVFTVIVVFTLALGVGANTAIFSIVNTTLLRALPYSDAHRLVYLTERNAQGETLSISYPNFLDWAEQQEVFEGLAIFHNAEARLNTKAGLETVLVQHVSTEFFNVFGVQPRLGRALTPADDVAGAARVAWLSHDAWQRFFQADPGVVGRALECDGRTLTVVGVLPETFRFFRPAHVFTAIAPFAQEHFLDMRANHSSAMAVARLAPGISLAGARTHMNGICQRLEAAYPEANKGINALLVPLREQLAGGARTPLLLLLGAVGLVLLIACVNVANMLLSRALDRQREMAVRASLGASRWRLMRQLLVESIMLSVLGSAAGLVLGLWGFAFVERLIPFAVQRVIPDGGFDIRLLLFVVAITVATGIGFGLAPAWQLSHCRPVQALKQTQRFHQKLFGRLNLGELLVTGQVAMALILLIGAGLVIRSLYRLLSVDPGFEATHVLAFDVAALPMEQFQQDPHAFTRHYERVLESVQPLAGVTAAAVAAHVPFTGSNNDITFYCADRAVPKPGEFPNASLHSVTPDYFRAMGIALLGGRLFDGSERPYNLPNGVTLRPENLAVIFQDVLFSGVISRKMADRTWPGQDPIGKRFRLGSPNMGLPWVEVIGVVGNTTQFGLEQGETAEFYLSLRQWPLPTSMALVVRTQQPPEAMVGTVRRAAAKVIPDDPLRNPRVLAELVADSTAGRRFNRTLFACFAGIALSLAVVGLYGVMAFRVGRRTREIGIRMALGARRADVMQGVIHSGLLLVIPGLFLGLLGAWAVGRLLQSQLFEVTAHDPLTYVTGTLLMLITAGTACWVPTRRAARVNPMEALRYE